MSETAVDLTVDCAEPSPSRSALPPDDSDLRGTEALATIGRGMILAGIVVMFFVVFQLWGTNLHEARAQDRLRSQLGEHFATMADTVDPSLLEEPLLDDGEAAVDSTTSGPEQEDQIGPVPAGAEADGGLSITHSSTTGDALARIVIPSIGVDKIIVRGVAVTDLRQGPGHYDQTALPGNRGNTAIAGHRSTYGAPFARLDELVPGNEITIASVQGEFAYRVLEPAVAYADQLEQVEVIGIGHIIVDPRAVWVLGDFGDDRLTLTACHPKLSSRHRIVVAAELVDEAVGFQNSRGGIDSEPRVLPGAESDESAASSLVSSTLSDTGSRTERRGDATMTSRADTANRTREIPRPDPGEGLGGERSAVAPAVVWMIAATTFWYTGGRLGARFTETARGRIGFRLAGLAPALVCLWFSFELIDRALPAA